MTDLFSATFDELAQAIRGGELSPVELTTAHLQRIATHDSELGSFLDVFEREALESAQKAEDEIANGDWRGPLHGMPVAVKDNIDIAGKVTTNGMVLAHHVAQDDAGAARGLREAGAVFLGKLKLTEGAFGEHHASITPPVNPWGAKLWPGASSSGPAVATAMGLCVGTLGTDTGGSIRFPCDVTGLTGLKPTYGLVSRSGVSRHSPSMDHVGPMGRDIQTVIAMTNAIAGPDPLDPTTFGSARSGISAKSGISAWKASGAAEKEHPAELRIGFDPSYCVEGVAMEIAEALTRAMATFEELNFRIVEVQFPSPDAIIEDYPSYAGIEMAAAHRTTFAAHKDEYGVALHGLIERGLSVSSIDFHEMIMRRADYCGHLTRFFENIDIFLTPTASYAAPTLAQMAAFDADPEALRRLIRYSVPFNMTGLPTLVLPCGQTDEGNPFTMQLVGPEFSEDRLFQAGTAFQAATEWHLRRPPLYAA